MVSMGFGNMGWNDSQWITIAEGSTPFHSVGFYFNTGNTIRENLFVALYNRFKLIAVELYDHMACDP